MGIFVYMKIEIPEGNYVKEIIPSSNEVEIRFGESKKVALLFICLNDRYWPYLAQVINDCKKNFLKNHKVDFFIWTDYNEENKKKQIQDIDDLLQTWVKAPQESKQEALSQFLTVFVQIIRLYEHFYAPQLQAALQELANQGLFLKREGLKFWFECSRPVFNEQDVRMVYEVAKRILLLSQTDMDSALIGSTIIDTEAVPWPSPTLMRYHLFLNEEEKLKEYDQLFYMDADMRVVSEIGDDIMSEGLTAAPHPGYVLASKFIPPYEPNPESTAYIHRLGELRADEKGNIRFMPFYAAGGFQGGSAVSFIEAMHSMKSNIDTDFDKKNYIAVWNDESHWNKYLWDFKGKINFLDVSYVMPDSLIKEYYEKIWGRSYEPKIITLTKPFTLSSEGAQAIQEMTKL